MDTGDYVMNENTFGDYRLAKSCFNVAYVLSEKVLCAIFKRIKIVIKTHPAKTFSIELNRKDQRENT